MTPPLPSPSVLVERRGAVAWIFLNRPEAANAIDVGVAEALLDAVIACDANPDIRCVAISGKGRMFCAGGDVRQFAHAASNAPELLAAITTPLHAAISRLADLRTPTIAVVNGPTAGAGLGLALACDLVLASATAHFTLGYGRIGLSPDAGATWFLPRLIGLGRARELMLTNRRLSAREALDWGMITEVCRSDEDAAPDHGADDRLIAVADRLTQACADGATGAWSVTRELLNDGQTAQLSDQLAAEASCIVRCGGGAEAAEGFAAFSEGRVPDFRLNAS